jgi:hypothetical protein
MLDCLAFFKDRRDFQPSSRKHPQGAWEAAWTSGPIRSLFAQTIILGGHSNRFGGRIAGAHRGPGRIREVRFRFQSESGRGGVP